MPEKPDEWVFFQELSQVATDWVVLLFEVVEEAFTLFVFTVCLHII